MPKADLWTKTKTQFVYRHKQSGRYYVRAYAQGREVWKALGTTSYQVARGKAKETLDDIHKGRRLTDALVSGKPTVGEVAELHRENIRNDVTTKQSTKHYWLQTIEALFRSWPGLETMRLSAVTEAQCKQWAAGYLKSTRAAGPGWKTEPEKTISASRFNNTLSTLRAIFDVGIKHGVVLQNPGTAVGRVSPKQKPIRIPTREQFASLVSDIRNAQGAVSQCSADLVEFLAFSGCRIDESRWVKWTDVDRAGKQIFISGHEHAGTKSGDGRWIPIIPSMERLLGDLAANPRYPRSARRRAAGYVLAVRECQKAIDRACERLKVRRFSHHDLRHLFATTAIESGVDIITVSRWLGHRDGGALAMRTYGHLRSEHSRAMAEKVTF
ncbi:MAG TPA: site-specific integrase [Chthoniobacterales bacterium]|nr:site-specific integrase [Chthoniobacterales bacterium]